MRKVGVGAGVVLGLMVVVALAAPALAAWGTHYGPTQLDLDNAYVGPGPGHWLGTDQQGRDTLTRLLFGARVSLGVGFLSVAFALVIGIPAGLAAGYYGGLLDELLMRMVDVMLAVPAIFLFVMMAILLRPGPVSLAVIIASVGWGGIARVVRAETAAIKARDFVLATRSLGASDLRIVGRHILPNVLPSIIVYASLNLGQVILAEATLDYLGLGIPIPNPSWGNMLSNASDYYYHSGYLLLFPGLAIFITVLSANLFGNALRDAFDPRLS